MQHGCTNPPIVNAASMPGMHDGSFRAQGREQLGSLITSTWSKTIPPECGHGRMLVMNLHEKLVDHVNHLWILQPSLQYRPFCALDIHLHDHSVGRGEVPRLFHESGDVHNFRGVVVRIRHKLVVDSHPLKHPVGNSGSLFRDDRTRTPYFHIVVFRELHFRKLEQLPVDLEGVDFLEVARVSSHEPLNARLEGVRTKLQVHASRPRIQIHLASQKPGKKMLLVFHICRELQRVTATEGVAFVEIFDQFPLDSTSRRFSYPFHLIPGTCFLLLR